MSESIKTVLIVDDEAFIRQSFFDYFEDRLWRPLQAESGEEALFMLKKESPHGAIVDIRMGGMDGHAFIREAIRKKPNMAFVICTGSPRYDIPADLLKLPCVSSHMFKKPVIHMAEVEKALCRLIANIDMKEVENHE
jgi:YesN/AraC family two-component response regulator